MNALQFVRMSDNAYPPTKATSRAAGFDLYSAYDYEIKPQDIAVVSTDLQIKVPSGSYGRIAPRSGLAIRCSINVGGGVVDEDYRGNVGVILFNHGKEPYQVKKGDRVAQLICERIFYPLLEECNAFEPTIRGAGGFGSTGV